MASSIAALMSLGRFAVGSCDSVGFNLPSASHGSLSLLGEESGVLSTLLTTLSFSLVCLMRVRDAFYKLGRPK